jgi:hypothetical protein
MMVVMMMVMLPVEVVHVVVVVVLIEYNVEVAGVYPRLLHACDTRGKTVEGQGREGFLQLLRIDPEVDERGHGHVAADAGIAFKVK